MADWFKFYENDLDETRLRYAISKLPEVIPVWVGILSEACRDKSGTISWGTDEIELFGFSSRLGVSVPKVNEAVNLLVDIRYITKQDGRITIIKWNDKQSEYCQKKALRKNLSGETGPTKNQIPPDSVPTVSRHTPDSVLLEERRGEEKRVEEKRREETTSEQAEAIYQAYPLKVGKPAALKAIRKALLKEPFDSLLAKTLRFAEVNHGSNAFVPNPSTWFNQERFTDSEETWKPRSNGQQKPKFVPEPNNPTPDDDIVVPIFRFTMPPKPTTATP